MGFGLHQRLYTCLTAVASPRIRRVFSCRWRDSFLEDDVAVLRGLAGHDDGVGLSRSAVKVAARESLDGAGILKGIAIGLLHFGIEGIAANGSHHVDGLRVAVELKERLEALPDEPTS